MDIFIMNGQAFVKLDPKSNYLLCIGSKTEIDNASPQELVERVHEAIVVSQYHSLNVKGLTLH